MLRIGDLSKATQLTIKTLRLYHEKGLLVPAVVDEKTGYRYYNKASVERARVIKQLRKLEFSLSEIAVILAESQDEADMISFLEGRKRKVSAKLQKYTEIQRSLDFIIEKEKAARARIARDGFEIVEKKVEDILVAGIRGKGEYAESGKRFSKLGRSVGRHLSGKPLNLFYDEEYAESDADFESCFPIRKVVEKAGVSVRTLEGGAAVTLLHLGPYASSVLSYQRIFEYIAEKELTSTVPSREVYVKGPGMIFKGNAKKYLTEIQVFVSD